jgi:hypothetical protein
LSSFLRVFELADVTYALCPGEVYEVGRGNVSILARDDQVRTDNFSNQHGYGRIPICLVFKDKV